MMSLRSLDRLTAVVASAALACAGPGEGGADLPAGSFRGGAEHRGAYESVTAGRGAVAWELSTAGAVRGSPLVAGDFVFVGSADGFVYAADRTDGTVRWRFEAESPVQSTPALADGTLYFGDRANRFYALDAASGRERWRVETGHDVAWEWAGEAWDFLTSSPVVIDGMVIVGSGDGNVYAFDSASGEEMWRFDTEARVRASPAVAEGAVYVGSTNGVLYALRASTGEPVWRYETEGASLEFEDFGFDRRTIQSSPAVAGGRVFFGSRDGHLYAVDAETGELQWRFDHEISWVPGSPAVREGQVFVGSSDRHFVHAVDAATGAEIWRFETGSRVFSSPALAGETLFVGDNGGRLLALDAPSGTLRWSLHFGGAVMSSPVVDGETVFVGADDGALHAVALRPGPPPRLAVYWDEARLAANTFAGHETVRDHLESVGYERVDEEALAALMQSHVEEGESSVVVFAMDDVPPSVRAEPPDSSLLRRYLEAGGKVVWLGLPPLLLERGDEGAVIGVDRARPQALLGVDFEDFQIDRYSTRPTPEGERWGLEGWWIGASGVDTAGVDAVLARDELGRATTWTKEYGGRPGMGFVMAWGSYYPGDAGLPERVRRLAEAGVTRSFSLRLSRSLEAKTRDPGTNEPAARDSNRPLVLSSVRVVDPASGTVIDDAAIVIKDQTIDWVGRRDRLPPSAAEYRALDLHDWTLLPGLIDAHVHLTLGADTPRSKARTLLDAGFTTVADLGATDLSVLAFADSVATGAVEGPSVLAAGEWLGMRGGTCDFAGIGSTDVEALASRLARQAALGTRVAKLCVTAWVREGVAAPDSVEIDGTELGGLVQQARAAGQVSVAHAIGRSGATGALDAGVTALAHAAWIDADRVSAMRRAGQWMIPTLFALSGCGEGFAELSAHFRGLVEQEVPIVFGTDAGAVPFGSHMKEIRMLTEHGLTPVEVLAAATANAAAMLRIADSVGRIQAGYRADLIAVDGHPDRDIEALNRVMLVLKGGRVMRP